MRADGKVNIVGLVLLAAVVGGIWWVITFSGVYLQNLDVKEVVAACYNESARASDDAMRARIADETSRIGTHKAEDGFGNLTEVKGLGLDPDQITIFRDEVRNTILIKVEYDREVDMWPLGKTRVVHFVTAKEGAVPAQ